MAIQPVAIPDGQSAAIAPSPRVRLDYLDSLRGLAAFEVVLHHAFGFGIGTKVYLYPRIVQILYPLFLYGHYAVDLFIVLSGYCLMIPVVKSEGQTLSGGITGFFKRRARRILPSYYAALIISAVLFEVTHHLYPKAVLSQSMSLNAFIAHVFLLHDFFPGDIGQVNAALWSIAVEWQIYFVFALVLLPIWKKYGAIAVILSGLLFSLPVLFIHNSYTYTWGEGCPWYIALFGMGMTASAINFSNENTYSKIRTKIPWKWLPAILLLLILAMIPMLRGSKVHIVDDSCLGILAASFLAYTTNSITTGKTRSPLVRLLEWKPLVTLGVFSFSIYLVHIPVLDLLRAIAPPSSFHPAIAGGVVIPFEVVFAVAAAYLFYLLIERRFQTIPKTHIR